MLKQAFGFFFTLCTLTTGAYAAVPTVASILPNAGINTGGQTMTITGTNFNNPIATAVNFGGTVAVSFTVINDTTILAVTPFAASGAVSVNVTNASGTNIANALYTFTSTNVALQIAITVTIPKSPDIQWGGGTSLDDLGVDHTAPAQSITPYVWIVKDNSLGANLDVNVAYLSNDTTNAKTIMLENVTKTNSTETITAVASDTAKWTVGAAPGSEIFKARAKLGAGGFQTLSASAAAVLTNNLLIGAGNMQALVVEMTTPTQTAAADVGVQQISTLSLIATAN